jgi:CIC family chloride channel protein
MHGRRRFDARRVVPAPMPPSEKTMSGRLRQRRELHPLLFSFLAVLVGGVAGLGAAAFRALIALFHNLLFLGKISAVYDANVHTPADPWGAAVILVPVVGALGVSFLVSRFAPEARGHGVPEVMDAIYYAKGVIRPVVAVVKSLASALSIGSGGSVGREGPIIQIGSSFGSTVGQVLPMSIWQRITLIAAGAAGGIAATFNTPIGGILFAAELLMQEISVRTLVPVAIATATATYIGRLLFGAQPSFSIPSFEQPYFHPTMPLVLFAYIGLGLLMGLIAALYIKSLYGFEDFFEHRVRVPYPVRHMLGMLAVGIMLYLMWAFFGHYYIEGVGYATVQDVLTGDLASFGLLLLLFALKLLSTSLTLGSGASGGIFSPSLFMGATLGGAYGVALKYLFPGLPIAPPAFAVAGMAGLVGGATGAAVTSIVMIFEMTLDYSVIIPITITVALSYGMRTFLSRQSIYTMKLARRGHYFPDALQTNIHYLRRAREIMEKQFSVVEASTPIATLPQIALEHRTVPFYLVREKGRLLGIATSEAVLETLGEKGGGGTLGEIANRNFILAAEDTTLFEVLARMRKNKTSFALVARRMRDIAPADVLGVITAGQIMEAIEGSIELFAE